MKSEAKQSQVAAMVYLPALDRWFQSMAPNESVIRAWHSRLEPLASQALPMYKGGADNLYRYWCHLVEFVPDHAGVQLARVIVAEQAELQRFVDLLNEHFSERKIRFEITDQQLWVSSTTPLPADWKSIYDILGTNIYYSLGNEANSTWWFAVLNEIQMLLANHSTAYPFNGLWLSQHPSDWIKGLTQLSGEKPYEWVFYSLAGMEYWIAQDRAKGLAWLKAMLEKVESLRHKHHHLIVCDGQSRWLLANQGWLQKLKQRMKGWLSQ